MNRIVLLLILMLTLVSCKDLGVMKVISENRIGRYQIASISNTPYILDTTTGKVWHKIIDGKANKSWECINVPMENVSNNGTNDPLGLFSDEENAQRANNGREEYKLNIDKNIPINEIAGVTKSGHKYTIKPDDIGTILESSTTMKVGEIRKQGRYTLTRVK